MRKMSVALCSLLLLAQLSHGAPPVINEEQTVVVEFGELNMTDIVLSQGLADGTLTVLAGPVIGNLFDFNGNFIDASLPVVIPPDGNGRILVKYLRPQYNAVADPDYILFKAENLAGEASFGVVKVAINLHPRVEIFTSDPRSNPGASPIASVQTFDPNLGFVINSQLLPTSAHPNDFITLWVRASDATGRSSVSSQQFLVDNQPPTVTWDASAPAENALVRDIVDLRVHADDNMGVVRLVRFRPPQGSTIDLTPPAVGEPWRAQYDTTPTPPASSLSDGLHTFGFAAIDLSYLSSGNLERNFRVDNTPPAPLPDISLIDNQTLPELTEIRATVNPEDTVIIIVDGNEVPYTETGENPTTFTLNPPITEDGIHTVIVSVVDPAGNPRDREFIITISQNQAPVAADDNDMVTPEGAPVVMNVLENDSDPNNDNLTITAITNPSIGSASIVNNNTRIRFVPPNNNFNGEAYMTYTVSDGRGLTATANVTITVMPVNDNPDAVNDMASTLINTAVDIDVIANDSDVDGDTLSIGAVSGGFGTAVKLDDRHVRFTPREGQTGQDSFTYVVIDGKGGTDSAVVTVGITSPANEAPVAVTDKVDTDEDVAVDNIDVLNNDTDPDNDTLTVESAQGASHGTTFVNPNGTIRYTPAANFSGNDSFTYTVSDGNGHFVNGTVNVTVRPVNDAPEVVVRTPNVQGDISGPIVIDIDPTDLDGDGTVTTVTIQIDNNPPVTVPGPDYRTIIDALPDGDHRITIVVDDNDSPPTTTIIDVTVNNDLPFTTPGIDDGDTVSGTVVIDVDHQDGPPIDRVVITVNGTQITPPLENEPFDFPWPTDTLPNGDVNLVIEVTDTDGKTTTVSKIVHIDNTTNFPEPTIHIASPGDDLSGVVRLSVPEDEISWIQFLIDGEPMGPPILDPNPTTHRFEWDWNTVPAPPAAPTDNDGEHTISARYVISGGVQRQIPPIIIFVDNARPTFSLVAPTAEEMSSALFGSRTFTVQVNAGSRNIDRVEARIMGGVMAQPELRELPGHADANNVLYNFPFDTVGYQDGDYRIAINVVDRAANQAGWQDFTFKINNTNPPYAGRTIISPADKAFLVTNDGMLKITARFEGANLDGGRTTGQGANAISVYVTKNGVRQELQGAITVTGNILTFEESIPENSKVEWILNDIRDIDGKVFGGVNQSYTFTHAMPKARGGVVTTPDQLFTLDVPANALPENLLITITDEGQIGGKIIAGPFKITAVNQRGESIVTMSKAADCTYSIPPSENDPDSPHVFQLAELFDNGKIFPLGSTKGDSAVQQDPIGSRSIRVPISRFGRFVITSEIIPEPGLTHFYNFPNPFSPNQGGTDFSYFLGADSSVSIVIYDLFGQVVRSFEIPIGATGGKLGLNRYAWDGKNGSGEVIANGGYIARVFAVDGQGNRTKATYKVGVLK